MGRSRQHANEVGRRWPKPNAFIREAEFANAMLVLAASLFDDRDRAAYRSLHLEITQHHNGIAEVAQVERRFERTDEPMLSENKDRHDTALPEIGQQFVHLQDQETLVRHCIHVAVQAVDNDDAGTVVLDASLDVGREFA